MTRMPSACAVVAILLAHASLCAAGEADAGGEDGAGVVRFALGAYASLGASWSVVKNSQDAALAEMYERGVKPRFAGGGGVYFDFYPAMALALDVAIGLVGKGHGGAGGYWQKVLCLRIPLGAKLSLHGVRIGLSLALDVAIVGRSYADAGESPEIVVWGDYQWRSHRRFNLGPLLSLGYAIHVKKIEIVPGVSWSMDLLDDAIAGDEGEFERRNMTLMFDVGLELGLGGGD